MRVSRRLALSLFVVFLGFSLIAYVSFARREKNSAISTPADESATASSASALSDGARVSSEELRLVSPTPGAPARSKAAPAAQSDVMWPDGQTQEDSQGAVRVTIAPLNLNTPDEQLAFDVALNTHSVDLGMDLAALSSLATDTGLNVQAIGWDAPRGGHHVRGTLYFPASVDGAPLLQGARKVTLVVTDVDAPERVFVWER